MTVEFEDLKALAEEDLKLTLSDVLAARTLQYQDVMPEEILDLLEEAAVTYSNLAPTLSVHLQNTSKKEIEFFVSLYQDSLKNSFYRQPKQPQLSSLVISHYLTAKDNPKYNKLT